MEARAPKEMGNRVQATTSVHTGKGRQVLLHLVDRGMKTETAVPAVSKMEALEEEAAVAARTVGGDAPLDPREVLEEES